MLTTCVWSSDDALLSIGNVAPQGGRYTALKSWVNTMQYQLDLYGKDPTGSSLTEERRQKLLNLGCVPVEKKTPDERWEKKFQLLGEYKQEFGNCKYITTEML